MSAIERGLYVTVGAADLAAEKVRELPAVKFVVERTNKVRETSLIDQAREIEPKVRKQAEELQARGEKVVKRVRKDAKDFQQQLRSSRRGAQADPGASRRTPASRRTNFATTREAGDRASRAHREGSRPRRTARPPLQAGRRRRRPQSTASAARSSTRGLSELSRTPPRTPEEARLPAGLFAFSVRATRSEAVRALRGSLRSSDRVLRSAELASVRRVLSRRGRGRGSASSTPTPRPASSATRRGCARGGSPSARAIC